MKFKHWDDCTFAEKLERWVQAKRVLKELPKHEREKHWLMAHWGVKTECGTVCCAAGHCGLDPWFRKRGLKLKPYVIPKAILEDFAEDGITDTKTILENLDNGQGGFEDDVRIEDFFGEENVFTVAEDRTVNEVIKEIDLHIKDMKTNRAVSERERKEAIAEVHEDYKQALKDAKEDLKNALADIEIDYAYLD